MKNTLTKLFILSLLLASYSLHASEYALDTKGAHAFIQFKIKHLGYSWLLGRFNKFDGDFSYDEKDPSSAKVSITIDMKSIDSNHAERDKHLRSDKYLAVDKFPTAKFVSTSFTESKNGKAILKGDLTLHGVTKSVTLDAEHIGNGPDPWGGSRRGFAATTTLKLKDFDMNFNLGPAAKTVELFFSVEGIEK